MNGCATNTNRSVRFPIVTGVVLAAILGLSGVRIERAQARSTQPSGHSPAIRPEARRHWFQFGRASWYGHDFQGQPTASGEAYDMNAMTCAHRNLPLGALVRVTNLRNHRSVVVRVNDRGPVPETRVVDLSYGAAKLLGFASRGTARVRIDLVDTRPSHAEVAHLTYPELGRGQ